MVAVDNQRGVAKNGDMPPWHLKKDEAYFTEQTLSRGGQVLMGKKTFVEALRNKPLKDRTNYVVTRDPSPIAGVQVVNSLEHFIQQWPKDKDLWVIGGSEIFVQTMDYVDELYVTEIEADFACDRFYPPYKDDFTLVSDSGPQSENGLTYYFRVYTPKR
jgi:dihydrofolate reductase